MKNKKIKKILDRHPAKTLSLENLSKLTGRTNPRMAYR
jgi:hypothetical protein